MSALAQNALVLVSKYGPPHVFLTLTCNPEWPEIKSQLLVGQSAFDRPDVTVTVFKSRLDQMKANIRNGKYFGSRGTIYIFHVIEYQYCGLPHAHMVFRLEDAYGIDAENQQALIEFVDSYFIAEMPQFEGEDFQNIDWWDVENDITQEYKDKAVEMVCTHNIHKCAGRHWIGGKRGEVIVGDEHVLMRTENISCNFAKQRRFSCTQQEIGSFLFCFSFLDLAIGLWEKGLDFLAPNTSSCQ
jgi:hypothetical protein